jgi:uncharacterized protein YodC (DUF2158 family)
MKKRKKRSDRDDAQPLEDGPWNIGDKVRLSVGGPDMVVVDVDAYSLGFKCAWFDGKKAQSKTFPPQALERVKEEKTGDQGTGQDTAGGA